MNSVDLPQRFNQKRGMKTMKKFEEDGEEEEGLWVFPRVD